MVTAVVTRCGSESPEVCGRLGALAFGSNEQFFKTASPHNDKMQFALFLHDCLVTKSTLLPRCLTGLPQKGLCCLL
jgi:hypothetical protein